MSWKMRFTWGFAFLASFFAVAHGQDLRQPPRRGVSGPAFFSPKDMAQEKMELSKQAAPEAGSAEAPLLFCIGLHIEPLGARVSELVGKTAERPFGPLNRPPLMGRPGGPVPRPDYSEAPIFQRHIKDIKALVSIVEKHGGKLTVQAQTPFTRVAAESGETILADLAKSGHEIALHFHEEPHLGPNCNTLPAETWSAVMAEEIGWIKKAVGKDIRVRYWSGGNIYPRILEAASGAGLDVMSDHKNPRRQQTDEAMLAVGPWRPAGGPKETDIGAFAKHDPAGKIVYLPDGIFASADFAERKRQGDWVFFDYMTDGLERSLRAARKDCVNVFHVTAHPGEFRGPLGREPFEVVDRWLTQVVDPLVKAGKLRWATFSEMADAYVQWEKSNPGVGPRRAERKDEAAAPAAALRPTGEPSKAYVTFAVNTHDWAHVDSSADTILRLIKIFQKNKVRGDFYLTAQITERYAEQRPDVIKALVAGNMTISYHVRPPHPTYIGFDQRLKGLDEKTLVQTLRDYETYRLNLATGDLQRDRSGGYAFVAKTFGKPPVCVSPQTGDMRIKNAVDAVYREMGAKMVLLYHESGTLPDKPLEYHDGLVVRPSDFSITRWALEGEPVASFWWNRLDGPNAAAFHPTEWLKSQLAEWRTPRPPFVTALIHENNFYRRGPEAWTSVYYSDAKTRRPLRPPHNLNAPDESKPRTAEEAEKIWRAYENLVAYAADNLRVVTSEDIVKLAESGASKTQQNTPQALPKP